MPPRGAVKVAEGVARILEGVLLLLLLPLMLLVKLPTASSLFARSMRFCRRASRSLSALRAAWSALVSSLGGILGGASLNKRKRKTRRLSREPCSHLAVNVN